MHFDAVCRNSHIAFMGSEASAVQGMNFNSIFRQNKRQKDDKNLAALLDQQLMLLDLVVMGGVEPPTYGL